MKFISWKSSFTTALCIGALGILPSCSTPRGSQFIQEADYSTTIRVACVGDSITYGYGIKNRERESYPAQLAALLGAKWEVQNFGVNGATAIKNGTRPYSEQKSFHDALSFEPDVVVIKLGTNDTNPKTWPAHQEEFFADYLDLIRRFSALKSKPRIYLCRPVPLFRDRGKEYDTDKILIEEIIPQIEAVSRKEKLPLIDLYSPFEGKTKMFPDGVHPGVHGAGLMAEIIYTQLTGRAVGKTKSF